MDVIPAAPAALAARLPERDADSENEAEPAEAGDAGSSDWDRDWKPTVDDGDDSEDRDIDAARD